MNCDCIQRVDEKLAEQNLALDVTFLVMKEFKAMLSVSTHWKDPSKKPRGKKPASILVTFCPFCGTKVESERNAAPHRGAEKGE
jgi:hypothetical protein